MTEDAIEMTCHLRCCPQCQDDPLSPLSVLGCNFYDDHEIEHHHEPANESSDEDNPVYYKIENSKYNRIVELIESSLS